MTNPIYLYALLGVSLVLVLVVVMQAVTIARRGALLDDVHDYVDQLSEEHERMYDEISCLVTVVSPLLEKTDWMTGRWGGQFTVLVRMEERRNQIIDDVRRFVMSTYPVERQVEDDPDSLMPKIGEIL